MKIRIAILGEFDPQRPSRALLGPALKHSAAAIGLEVHYEWISSALAGKSIIPKFNAIFVGPGAPDEDIGGILKSIQMARLHGIPCLGTCGGFQRVVTEYALNELGFENLENQEISPTAVDPFFSQLNCSLVGQEAEVILTADSLAAKIYQSNRVMESFFCGYGVNPQYLERLQSRRMKVSAHDSTGEARIVELTGHPFFLATLFVPQVRSAKEDPHPLITAFLKAATV